MDHHSAPVSLPQVLLVLSESALLGILSARAPSPLPVPLGTGAAFLSLLLLAVGASMPGEDSGKGPVWALSTPSGGASIPGEHFG